MFSACCSLAVWVPHVVNCSEPLWHSLLWYWQERLTAGLALQFSWQMFALTISYSSRRHSTGVAHLHPARWHDLPEVGGACWAQRTYNPIWGGRIETRCWISLFVVIWTSEDLRRSLFFLGVQRLWQKCFGWHWKSTVDLGNKSHQTILYVAFAALSFILHNLQLKIKMAQLAWHWPFASLAPSRLVTVATVNSRSVLAQHIRN